MSQDDAPMPSPALSVVMSVYNGEAYLAEAIDSVLAQTMADFEFLIHDDGSTDATLRILRAYEARDPRVSVSTAPNQGIAASVNGLIRRARAPFIARFDADDICLPDRFERQLPEFGEDPDLVALGAGYITMDEEGRPTHRVFPPFEHAEIDAKLITGFCALHQPTVMIRRAALERVGLYDETLRTSEDFDLWLRLAEEGTLRNLPLPLVKYRLHGNSIMSRDLGGDTERAREVTERAWRRRGIEGQFRANNPTGVQRRSGDLGFALEHGWKAWKAGYRDTWRHYALKAVRTAPFSAPAWKLLLVGGLRRPKPGTRGERGTPA